MDLIVYWLFIQIEIMVILEVIAWIVITYLFCGFLFAIPFVSIGVSKIDEGARGSGWGFKLIIIPGTVVFWPFLLRKWMRAHRAK